MIYDPFNILLYVIYHFFEDCGSYVIEKYGSRVIFSYNILVSGKRQLGSVTFSSIF